MISGERHPPGFCASSWLLAIERIRDLRKEFPNISKEQIAFNVHAGGENDVEGTIARNHLIAHEMSQKLSKEYPELEYDDFCFVVPHLQKSDSNPNPQYDLETAARKILTNFKKRRVKVKAWQDEHESNFDDGFDNVFNECMIEVLQTLNGCFHCKAANPTKICSKCKLAKYCSKECQASSWKKKDAPHKEECKMFCTAKDRKVNGGPVPLALYSIGIVGESLLDLIMEKRTSAFLDELCRCNNATREIIKLNIAVAWNWGKMACLQGVVTFRDDTITVVTETYVLYKELCTEEHVQGMISEGCGDIPENEKTKVIIYLNNFFRQAMEREITITEMTCSRATLWLCKEEYKRKLGDPNSAGRSFFDPPYGPIEINPSPTYIDQMPS
mmetsp:Transcript_834/g.1439  ORF Transcript_834/g.1439 Transcript_834/m.1439 type:complete len:386 (+) Transcript_834:67-1224(+)